MTQTEAWRFARALAVPLRMPAPSKESVSVCMIWSFRGLRQRAPSSTASPSPSWASSTNEGGKIAVVSVDEDCDALLETAGISELFDARIGGSASNGHHLSGKAVLNVYLQWAETLGVDPRGTVLVENAVTEIRAARAGRFGRVVRVGQRDELGSHEAVDILRSDGADVVVDLWVLTTRPSSSGRHPVFVDDAAQTVGSS